ncbi:efflux RND transporter periplasmic adaptor subunit [Acinetobacter sp. ANC 4945]|uniref:RND transporter n=1 Tax=Acinetobacter amyesii TaxID=2942470 RepID=A0A1T1GYN9_9GAMM|nr:efflux RND transporter periplasmic adaptor subunit [Acinetobacter amyesii]MCL6246770.1 efflux RND transporter periplasmic adaptor subunit [Acinetobacter amyesii]OOV82718.1 RND transporter [Acinetobacter amyesii]
MNQEPTDHQEDASAKAETSQSNVSTSDVSSTANTAEDTPKKVNTNTDAKTKNTSAHSHNKSALIKFGIGIVLVLLLALIVFGLWKSYQPKQVELQGRVEAETIHISTKVPSRIEEIYVHDGEKVQAGQALVRLTSPEVDAKKQQALAALQSAQALQSTAERGSQQENIDSLYANWQSLKAQQQLAQTTYQRGQNLYKEGVISRQRRDEMQAAAVSAAQMTEASYQQYARAKRGSTPQQQSSADAQVKIAQAALAEANALEAETKLFAPSNGTISKTYGKVSELVAMGVPVVSLIQDDSLWISLNVREDQYAQVYQLKTMQGFIPALNKSAEFKIDHIEAEGEFATIKTTRQTGGYDIRSFKVQLKPAQPIADLKVGMSVLFKIEERK